MKIKIDEYFQKGTFIIPNYQRGYKWAVEDTDNKSSLSHFMDSLIDAFKKGLLEYFIEAVTVVEEKENDKVSIILVDGQQRTTSLFLLFVTLGDYSFIKEKLKYEVRQDSHRYLNNLINEEKEGITDEDVQDIFYFDKAKSIIENTIGGIDKDEFKPFVKEKVFLLYNIIPTEKATSTFIALNGLKAIMKDEELIKSDLLIKSSRINEENKNDAIGLEWKINEDRGRLARNWDKWLYWWNQEAVKQYFGTDNRYPLYYLLVTYWNLNHESKNTFSFDTFKSAFISGVQKAKMTFEGLRKLQKTFEDLYNDYESHNFLGLILKTSNSKEDALQYFLNSKIGDKIPLEEYAKWSLVGATHLEIVNKTLDNDEDNDETQVQTRSRKAHDAIRLLDKKYVYWDENDVEFNDGRKEFAYRFLMLLNLLEDNKLNRKFDFSIWSNRSLEHIYPKSKKGELDFSTNDNKEGSIHCIGNLVLLYGKNNSAFGAKDFAEKKSTYFNISLEFKSRNLLHTLSVFANPDWKKSDIIKNKQNLIKRLNIYYGFQE